MNAFGVSMSKKMTFFHRFYKYEVGLKSSLHYLLMNFDQWDASNAILMKEMCEQQEGMMLKNKHFVTFHESILVSL